MITMRPAGRLARRPAGVGSGRKLSRIVATVLSVLAVLIVAAPVIAKTSAHFSDSEHAKIQVTAGAAPTTEPPQPAWDADRNTTYIPGALVAYGGHIWRAKWSVGGGQPPGSDGFWGPWEHACPPGTCTPPW